MGLPARGVRRGDEPIGPVTSITPPPATRAASARIGARVGVRLSVTAFVIVSLFCVLLARLWSLQLVQGAQLNDLARSDTTATIEIPAPRGEILTSDAAVLAGDAAYPEIVLARGEQQSHPAVVARLAQLLGIKSSAIDAQLKLNDYSGAPPTPVPVSPSKVTEADILYIKQYPTSFPGVTVTTGYQRTYPQHALAAQTIGYLGLINPGELKALTAKGYNAEDSIGQSGLESQYESDLRGKAGVDTFAIDPSGTSIGDISETAPVSGDSLVLNMNSGLEQDLTNELTRQITALRAGGQPAPWGAAVVLDPSTGAVLAISSVPSYDDNVWQSVVGADGQPGISQAEFDALQPPGCASGNINVSCPMINYVTQGLQPPGSTFKLVTATAALDSGLISSGTYYDDTGSFTVGDPPTTFHDSDNEALGEVNVTSALSESSDVFFYNLGAQLWIGRTHYGEDAIQKVAAEYGLGRPLGVDLPGASPTQVDSPALRKEQHVDNPTAFPNDSYVEGDNIETAFGQGETLVTPLALADAYATFANGGTRYAPEMAGAIVSPSGKLLQRMAPKAMGHVALPPATREPMLAGFEGAVQSPRGTAYDAFSGFDFSNWDVAGKTGTATTCAGDVNCQPTSWFVSFGGPRGGPPKYVVAVEVDQGGFGAAASAPVARQVFDYLVKHPLKPLSLPKGA